MAVERDDRKTVRTIEGGGGNREREPVRDELNLLAAVPDEQSRTQDGLSSVTPT